MQWQFECDRLFVAHNAYTVFDQARSYVWHHQYDELGNRIKTVRPDGHAIDWLTYGSGHVHGMLLDGEERIQFERDELHRETRRTLGAHLAHRTVYDPAGRMIQTALQREKAPMPIVDRRYRYDAAGQLTQIEDSRRGYIDYRYDPVGRLVEAASPWSCERFAFDPASNLVDAPAPDQPRMMTAAHKRREESTLSTLPQEVPKILGNLLKQYAGMHFTYNARGNLIAKRTPKGEQTYEWDAFNRLTTANVHEGERHVTAHYFYDALGRRIAKAVNDEQTIFGWDGDTLAYESRAQGSTHYVYEAGSFVPLAQFVTTGPVQGMATPVRRPTDRYLPEEDPLQRIPQPAARAHLFHYHCDQIGTPYMMTDELGEVVWEATYKAWGETQEVIARVSKATGVVAGNAVRFQGQQFDEESGLHYNRHRYYDTTTGRFISHDPIGLAGGFNLYQYAPTPTQWIDPLGLVRCSCDCSQFRRASLRDIRRQLGIPMSQQPISQKMVPLTDSAGARILGDDKQPIMTRELTYQVNGKNVIIQDHSAGHFFGEGGVGDQPSHHNVRPEDRPRTGAVDGMSDHYYFSCRNKK